MVRALLSRFCLAVCIVALSSAPASAANSRLDAKNGIKDYRIGTPVPANLTGGEAQPDGSVDYEAGRTKIGGIEFKVFLSYYGGKLYFITLIPPDGGDVYYLDVSQLLHAAYGPDQGKKSYSFGFSGWNWEGKRIALLLCDHAQVCVFDKAVYAALQAKKAKKDADAKREQQRQLERAAGEL